MTALQAYTVKLCDELEGSGQPAASIASGLSRRQRDSWTIPDGAQPGAALKLDLELSR
jgi:hypothetical protein